MGAVHDAAPLNGVEEWMLRDRKDRNMLGFARLKPGVTLEQAQEELTALCRRMAVADADMDQGMSATLLPMWKSHFGPQGLLLGAAAHPDGSMRAGAADRLRKCGESAVGAIGGATKGVQHAAGAGRGTGPAGAAGSDGEPAAGSRWHFDGGGRHELDEPGAGISAAAGTDVPLAAGFQWNGRVLALRRCSVFSWRCWPDWFPRGRRVSADLNEAPE